MDCPILGLLRRAQLVADPARGWWWVVVAPAGGSDI